MSRASCTVCLRPQKTCICYLFTDIDNTIDVVVLQHPTEVKQTKGTVTLLSNSLQHCTVIVGEDFSQNEVLHSLQQKYKKGLYLLYPSDDAIVVSQNLLESLSQNTSKQLVNEAANEQSVFEKPTAIIVLDGTWKKSYKMYMLNTFLHGIPHLTLPENMQGEYAIRKTQKANALSSLEACTYTLMMLESNEKKYQPLLTSFRTFNDVQLSFRQ